MQIDREGETVGLMSVEVMPVAREEKEFKKACRRAESVASVMKCKMRAIPNLQKEAFMHLSPTFPNHAKMESILQKSRSLFHPLWADFLLPALASMTGKAITLPKIETAVW